jgi:hypothetical protein
VFQARKIIKVLFNLPIFLPAGSDYLRAPVRGKYGLTFITLHGPVLTDWQANVHNVKLTAEMVQLYYGIPAGNATFMSKMRFRLQSAGLAHIAAAVV